MAGSVAEISQRRTGLPEPFRHQEAQWYPFTLLGLGFGVLFWVLVSCCQSSIIRRKGSPITIGYWATQDSFNAYIRGTLRDFVIAETGDEVYVSFSRCLLAFLPMIFYSSVNVLGCDNGPCEISAPLAGYELVSLGRDAGVSPVNLIPFYSQRATFNSVYLAPSSIVTL